jgi:hypothetical protein
MSRYAKAIAALLGGLTRAVVIGILALVHVHIDPTLAAGICTVLATLATIIAPANKTAAKPPAA